MFWQLFEYKLRERVEKSGRVGKSWKEWKRLEKIEKGWERVAKSGTEKERVKKSEKELKRMAKERERFRKSMSEWARRTLEPTERLGHLWRPCPKERSLSLYKSRPFAKTRPRDGEEPVRATAFDIWHLWKMTNYWITHPKRHLTSRKMT